MNTVSEKTIKDYYNYLVSEEKSAATIEKYIRDIKCFSSWAGDRALAKEIVLEYKKYISLKLSPSSANSVISSLNSFFDFAGRSECKIKAFKIQRKIFARKEKELTKAEYERLIRAAGNNRRLSLVMQTLCSCGIRVSEDI